jgi:hypothetical protein
MAGACRCSQRLYPTRLCARMKQVQALNSLVAFYIYASTVFSVVSVHKVCTEQQSMVSACFRPWWRSMVGLCPHSGPQRPCGLRYKRSGCHHDLPAFGNVAYQVVPAARPTMGLVWLARNHPSQGCGDDRDPL